MTPFPTNITMGQTYQTQLQITSSGPFTIEFYLNITGINASDEFNVSMDGGICRYADIWICGYNQSSAGVYNPKLYLTPNQYLDPNGSYSYRLDYNALEDAPNPASGASTTYYSSNGGASFAPRPSYKPATPAPAKNDTPKPPTPPTAQNTTIIPVVPPNQTIEPTAQNESVWPEYQQPIIQPIELIEPTQPEENNDYLLPAIAIGLLIVGLLVFGVYLMTRQKN